CRRLFPALWLLGTIAYGSSFLHFAIEGQGLSDFHALLDCLSRLGRAWTRVQEQHLVGADDRLEALLAALAILPRAGVQAADHAYTAALMDKPRAHLGQLVPRLDRRPVGFHRPAAILAAPSPTLGGDSEVADRRPRREEALLRLRPDPTDQLNPIDCSLDVFH